MADNVSAELIRLFYGLWEASSEGRDYVLSNELPESLEKVPRAEAADIRRSLRDLNRIGHLIAKGPLDSGFVTSLVGKDVIKIMEKLRPLVEEERTRLEEPDLFQYVDNLFEASRKAYPDYKPTYKTPERRRLGLPTPG
ncbi:MAG TPA: hypothetical protein VGK54_16010 [Chloroflexota bacterium]|jgi:hypothetical protein